MKQVFGTKLANDFLIYTLFSVFQKLIPFLLLPFFSRYLTQEQLGFYLVYQAIFLLAMPLMTLSLETSISVNFYYLKPDEFAKYLTNTIGIAGGLSLGVLLITFIFKNTLSSILDFPGWWLLIALCSVFPLFIYNVRQILFRYQNKPIRYGLFAVLASVLGNGLGFLFLFTTSLTWESFVLGVAIGYLFMALVSVLMLNREGFFNFIYSFEYIKDAVKIGFPVGLHVIGSWLSNSLNRILLNTLIGSAATSSYGIGATFGMIMTLLQDSVNLAYTPFLYEKLRDFNESTKIVLVKTGVAIYGLIIFSAILISVIGYWGVGLLFGDIYLSTRHFIIPLVISAAINGFYKIHVAYIFYSKRTFIVTRITLCCGFSNVVLSYFSITYFGVLGAVFSAVTIQLITYLLVMISANRLYDMNWLNTLKLIMCDARYKNKIGL